MSDSGTLPSLLVYDFGKWECQPGSYTNDTVFCALILPP